MIALKLIVTALGIAFLTFGYLIYFRKKYNLNLLAVRNNETPSMAVTSDTQLKQNQTILVLGTWKDIQKCFRI